MGPEDNCEDVAGVDEGVRFSQVSAVVTRWTADFLFVSLCRHFKEGKLDKFDQTLSTLEAMSQSPALREDLYSTKILIVAFLTRVIRGKQTDIQYDEDSSVMPLMSAAKLWLDLKSTVADEKLFRDITILLLVQAAAACLEKGDSTSAVLVLEWLEKERQHFPEGLSAKLTTVVKKGDAYHPLLMSFSFSRLLEKVHSYIDAYLQTCPSDHLIKAATEVLKSSGSGESFLSSPARDGLLSEPGSKSTGKKTAEKEKKTRARAKHKLMSTTIHEFWKCESRKKPSVPLRRVAHSELSRMNTHTLKKSPVKTSETKSDVKNSERKERKKPQKWTSELDRYLKEGVRTHGVGKWSRILLDYDFEGRTGTMLKDRWRTLTKAYLAG